MTAGLAVVAFFLTHYAGIRGRGLWGYLKSFLAPFALMLPLNLIEMLVRPFSLALRLFGNIFGEESVTENLYHLFPVGPPIIMMTLSLLFCAIQAMVFTMLTASYLNEFIEEE